MDLSKLPKLSQTPPPPPEAMSPYQPPGGGVDAGFGHATATGFCTQCGTPLAPGTRFCGSCGAPVNTTATPRAASGGGESRSGAGAEVYVGMVVGVVVLVLFPTMLKYVSSKLFGTPFAPYTDPLTNEPADYILMTDGTKIHYPQLVNFWSDLSLALFGLGVFVAGALVILSRHPAARLVAFLLVAAGTLANLLFLATHGLAQFSLLAVLFGAYLSFVYWSLFVQSRGSVRA